MLGTFNNTLMKKNAPGTFFSYRTTSGSSTFGLSELTVITEGDYEYRDTVTDALVSSGTLSSGANVFTDDLTGQTDTTFTTTASVKNVDLGQASIVETDTSGSPDLASFKCNGSSIASLDFTNNPALIQIYCQATPSITTLTLGSHPSLRFLTVFQCNIAGVVDTSQCPALEIVNVHTNQITALDISNSPNVNFFYCYTNQLTELTMNSGNNTNITTIALNVNPLLTCALVDDAAYSTTNWTNKDAQTVYSDTTCPP